MVREMFSASFLAATIIETGTLAGAADGLKTAIRFQPIIKDTTTATYRIVRNAEIRSGVFRTSKEIHFKDEITA